MPKPPPDTDQILRTVEVTTPPEWHRPALDRVTEQGQILRGNARTLGVLAETVGRAASRQMFVTPPGFEPAGFGVRASMVVQLERTQGLDSDLLFAAGKITAEGPRGRVYRSTADTQWFAFDPDGDVRQLELICDLIGEPGNLDYLADENGDLTRGSTGEPWLEVIDMQDHSQSRSGIRGVLTVAVGELATLTDNGAAPTFAPSDVGLYLRINYAGDVANIGRVLRIAGYSVAAGPAPDTNLFPRTIELDDGPIAKLIDAAQLDDGGAFTVLTAEARESTPDDVTLLPVVPAIGDAFYAGATEQFSFIELTITTQAINDLDLVWEYWDGGAWSTFGAALDDDSDSFRIAGRRRVSWSIDPAWASVAVNGIDMYWVRARVSAFVSQVQPPLAGRLFVGVADPLLADPLDINGAGQISWTILDAKDLGVSITSMSAPSGGRDNDLGLKLAERGVLPRIGENLDALRRRGSYFANAISPTLLEREINQVLNPHGLAGEIIEVGEGFTGLYWDTPVEFAPEVVGAWDLYGPGDVFPADLTMLPISIIESRWHFFVCVPPSTLGEYGAAWDEGPTPIFVEDLGVFIDSYWDYAFTDGSPWVSEQIYKQAWERINLAKGGGIAFTFIECDVPACPG